jgi:transglutaminase/protease-like cytokinesis protein 3
MDLAHIYRIFHPTSTKYTFFSAVHGTFSKTDHILGHKASLSKYKKIETIPYILSDHNALKLEINNKNNTKYANSCKLNNTFLNDQWVIDEMKEEIKRFLEVDKNENMENPIWRLEGGNRKRASYSAILEKRWRHTLQASPPRRGKTLTPPHLQTAQRTSTSL